MLVIKNKVENEEISVCMRTRRYLSETRKKPASGLKDYCLPDCSIQQPWRWYSENASKNISSKNTLCQVILIFKKITNEKMLKIIIRKNTLMGTRMPTKTANGLNITQTT